MKVNCCWYSLCCFLWSFVNLCLCLSQPQVKCLTGTYSGLNSVSDNGTRYSSFFGVQFAHVLQRFKEAVPVANNSNEVFNSTVFGPACFQKETIDLGVEDCLFLNIYTPDLNGQLPVLYFLYGGAFTMGSTYTFNAEYFMETKRIVVVTVNYRVGPFGFLYFDDPDYPANLGLRDQILGLQWVRQNIAKFGGDPNRITINGQSAGAASVNILMHSPMAKGLFVGGISESGTACSPWALQPRCTGLYKLQLLATGSGCDNFLPRKGRKWSAKPIADCFSKLAPKVILSAVANFPKWDLIVPFPPIVEEKSVPNPVITIFPWLKSSYSKDVVPWISGTNSGESNNLVNEYFPSNGILEKLAIKFFSGLILSEFLYYRFTSALPQLVTTQIQLHFFKDDLFNFKKFISEVTSLGFFYYPQYQCLITDESPTYGYYFDYIQRHPSSVRLVEDHDGVGHSGELPFLWKQSYDIRMLGSEIDTAVSQNLVNAWVDFAYYQSANYSDVTWERYSKEKNKVLVITNRGARMAPNPNRGQNAFWRSLKTNLDPLTSDCGSNLHSLSFS